MVWDSSECDCKVKKGNNGMKSCIWMFVDNLMRCPFCHNGVILQNRIQMRLGFMVVMVICSVGLMVLVLYIHTRSNQASQITPPHVSSRRMTTIFSMHSCQDAPRYPVHSCSCNRESPIAVV